jgi:iduronate 2-sulfatase
MKNGYIFTILMIIVKLSFNASGSREMNSSKLLQTNLLLIMFDDLRPELSIYGRSHMFTPNFERLAKRSVVFDYAYAQVAVCNPSRDSMLTGLRPDTVGTYNFQHSFRPHLTLPTQLGRSGYNTVGIGKLLHWDGPDKDIWNFYQWDNDWYKYQFRENNYMNSSSMPDRYRDEKDFRDHQFADKAISLLKRLVHEPKPYFLAVGFKLPHNALHVPYKYFSMYKNKAYQWRLSKKELRFPHSSPEVAYRCCAEPVFKFMRDDGALKANRSVKIGDINMQFTNEMRDELMMGYCAGVSFVDKQLGKLLDALDQLDLWKNTTVVLTADHGMHNGEKGLW